MQPDVAHTAALIGDPVRAKMLLALMSGKALTATELATEGDISAQTASSHLNKLVTGQLLQVRKQGRHKYFQLESPAVAQVLEQLLSLSARGLPNHNDTVNTGPEDPYLRRARVCYDHLAGEMGVWLFNSLLKQNLITSEGDIAVITHKGQTFFEKLGVNIADMQQKKRPVCRACLDWSERRSHLAGQLGQWILTDVLNRGWASRALDSRALLFTPEGQRKFQQRYQTEEPL